jgi:hypothetical protein
MIFISERGSNGHLLNTRVSVWAAFIGMSLLDGINLGGSKGPA